MIKISLEYDFGFLPLPEWVPVSAVSLSRSGTLRLKFFEFTSLGLFRGIHIVGLGCTSLIPIKVK